MVEVAISEGTVAVAMAALGVGTVAADTGSEAMAEVAISEDTAAADTDSAGMQGADSVAADTALKMRMIPLLGRPQRIAGSS